MHFGPESMHINLYNNSNMNIFLLHILAGLAAEGHCDKHCIKMILETTQLLYSAWWYGRETFPLPELDPCPYDPYKPTHKNHPSAIWTRDAPEHYNWLLQLGYALCREYYQRYGGKFHKCMSHLDRLQEMGPPPRVASETYSPPAHKVATTGLPNGIRYFHCAINDELWQQCAVYTNGQLNAVETYRKYYCTKPWQLRWYKSTDRGPTWYTPAANQASQAKAQTYPHSPVSIVSYNPDDASQHVSSI